MNTSNQTYKELAIPHFKEVFDCIDKVMLKLHVLGFREVLKNPQTVRIEEKSLQIPSLEGMAILKLIAWSDRPEFRDNDLYDILKIIGSWNTPLLFWRSSNLAYLKKHKKGDCLATIS